jgi:hypothetical protein
MSPNSGVLCPWNWSAASAFSALRAAMWKVEPMNPEERDPGHVRP